MSLPPPHPPKPMFKYVEQPPLDAGGWALNVVAGVVAERPEMTLAEERAADLLVGLVSQSVADGIEVAADACEEVGWSDAAEHLREIAPGWGWNNR